MAYADARVLTSPARDPAIPLFSVAMIGALLLAGLLIFGPALALAAVVFVALLGIAVVQPRTALYVVAFLSIACSSSMPFGESVKLNNTIPAAGIYLTPLELLMAAGVLGTVIRLMFDDSVSLRMGSLALPIAALIATIFMGMGYGIMQGANMSALRTETRAFFYLPALSLLATHFLRTRADLMRMSTVLLIAINALAAFSIYHYYADVRTAIAGSADLAYPHEDSVFCAAGVVLVLSRLVWSRSLAKELKILPLMILPLIAILVMRRRAGMVALDVALLMLCIVLVRDNLKLFIGAVPVAILGGGLLLALTWNDPGGLGQPARAFRAVTGSEQVSSRDQSSNDYRTLEGFNIRRNVEDRPLTGLGFGREYAFYVTVPDLSFWPMWRYEAHNSVLWLWMDAGILAFVALLSMFAAAIMRSTQLLSALRSDSLKPFAFALGAMVLMFVLYAYVDVGLTTPRAMVFLGLALGGLGALDAMVKPARGVPAQMRGPHA